MLERNHSLWLKGHICTILPEELQNGVSEPSSHAWTTEQGNFFSSFSSTCLSYCRAPILLKDEDVRDKSIQRHLDRRSAIGMIKNKNFNHQLDKLWQPRVVAELINHNQGAGGLWRPRLEHCLSAQQATDVILTSTLIPSSKTFIFFSSLTVLRDILVHVWANLLDYLFTAVKFPFF